MAYDADNVFARILRGEIPSHRVHEDAETIAIMDVMPQADGHVLVIPKAAATDLLEASPESLAATIATVQRVARAVKQAFGAPGIMIAQLNGAAAGQSVFHLHFHVIPRQHGAEMRLHAREMAEPARLTEHAARIRAALAEAAA
jgi:histidine triad (HIT) family protein